MSNIIFLDLELTQNKGSSPKIIQIGAVAVCIHTGKIKSIFSEVANPGEMPCRFISALTGIYEDEVAAARPLREVLTSFFGWLSQSQCGMEVRTWGGGDLRAIKEASEEYLKPDEIAALPINPLHLREVNVKPILSDLKIMSGLSKKGGLGASMKALGMDFIGREHDALWDAFNTARIYFLDLQVREAGLRALKRNWAQNSRPRKALETLTLMEDKIRDKAHKSILTEEEESIVRGERMRGV